MGDDAHRMGSVRRPPLGVISRRAHPGRRHPQVLHALLGVLGVAKEQRARLELACQRAISHLREVHQPPPAPPPRRTAGCGALVATGVVARLLCVHRVEELGGAHVAHAVWHVVPQQRLQRRLRVGQQVQVTVALHDVDERLALVQLPEPLPRPVARGPAVHHGAAQ